MVPPEAGPSAAELKAQIKESQALIKRNQRELQKLKKKAKATLSPNDSEVENLAAQITLVASSKGVKKKDVILAVAKKMRIGLTNGAGTKSKTAAVVKYRHPKNPELTWVGRGAMPKWLRDEVASGKKKEAFLV